MNTLTSLFQQGSLIQVPSYQRIFLHDMTSLLYIEEGEADIFALAIKETSRPQAEELASQVIPFKASLFTGTLHFLANIRKDGCLFSFPLYPSSPYVVVIVPQKALTLRRLLIKDIQKAVQSSLELKEALDNQLYNWLHQLSFLFFPYVLEYPDEQITSGSSLSIEANKTFTPTSWSANEKHVHLMWMNLLEGSLLFFNVEGLALHSDHFFFPLIKGMWFKAQAFSKVVVLEDVSLAYEDPYWKGLEQFHQLFLQFFAFHQAQLLTKESAKARLKIERSKANFGGALNELQLVLNREEYFLKQEHSDLLYNTCQVIGQQLNLNFTPLALTSRKLPLEESVYFLCFYSRIYYRQVSLIENWWKYDLGPFLGFYGEDERPVALIPSGGDYQLVDLKNQTSHRVNAKIDQELSSVAYMFYRSLPNKEEIKSLDLIKFSTYKRFKSFAVVLLLGSLGGLFNLFYPFINNVIFDVIIPNADRSLLWQVIIGLSLVTVGNYIFLFAREYTLLRLEGLMEQDLEAGIWQRVFNLRLQFFRRFELGDLLLRILSIKTIRQTLSGNVLRVLLNSFFSLTYLFSMFYYSTVLALVGTSVVLLGMFVSIWATIKNTQRNRKILDLKGKANNLVLQFLAAISKIRVAGSEHFSFVSWEKIFYQAKKLDWQVQKVEISVEVINFAISSLSILAIYTAALFLIKDNSLQNFTIGHFIAFMAGFGPFSLAISNLSLTFLQISHLFPMWKRSLVLFQEPLEVDKLKVSPNVLSGEIRIDHLSFRYEKNGPFILKDISLHIKPGELIGIVGYSGCGKSSLVKLLIGIEIPESGAIYYDGKDLTTLDVKLIRKQTGIVLQTSSILDGTIRENIIMEGFYADEEVERVLALSGFEEDLKRLPMGVHTVLMDGGNTLSGGQKQRLLIARALISKPKILIMDEATSALDNKTQALVSRNLDRLQVTRIVIAHRLNTIRHSDRIYVIDKGNVVDSGTFTELENRAGLFSEFLKKQSVN